MRKKEKEEKDEEEEGNEEVGQGRKGKREAKANEGRGCRRAAGAVYTHTRAQTLNTAAFHSR